MKNLKLEEQAAGLLGGEPVLASVLLMPNPEARGVAGLPAGAHLFLLLTPVRVVICALRNTWWGWHEVDRIVWEAPIERVGEMRYGKGWPCGVALDMRDGSGYDLAAPRAQYENCEHFARLVQMAVAASERLAGVGAGGALTPAAAGTAEAVVVKPEAGGPKLDPETAEWLRQEAERVQRERAEYYARQHAEAVERARKLVAGFGARETGRKPAYRRVFTGEPPVGTDPHKIEEVEGMVYEIVSIDSPEMGGGADFTAFKTLTGADLLGMFRLVCPEVKAGRMVQVRFVNQSGEKLAPGSTADHADDAVLEVWVEE